MKCNTNSVIINFFLSSDQVGAPLQRCGHLGSHGDHTHAPSRSIHSVSGITVHHSIRPHGNTHLQTNMVAPHLSKNYLFYSKLYCGSSITCVCQTTMQCRCTESLLANWKSFLFGLFFRTLYTDSSCTYEGYKGCLVQAALYPDSFHTQFTLQGWGSHTLELPLWGFLTVNSLFPTPRPQLPASERIGLAW